MSDTLLEYFGQLPQGVQLALFKDTWTCQAILRALGPMAQQYVLRLAGAQAPLPVSLVDSWALPTNDAQTKHEKALDHLKKLGLLSRVPGGSGGGGGAAGSSAGGPHYQLHKEFGAQLMRALRGGDAACGSSSETDKHKPTIEQLEAHARRTWEQLLETVLSPPPKPVKLQVATTPASSLQDLLIWAGLLTPSDVAEYPYAMGAGARAFLLQPVHTQVWRLMLAYMQLAEKRGASGARDALLSFIMRLGFLEQGVDYPTDELSDGQRDVLGDLVLLGLVYMRKLNSRRYYTTPLAVQLLSGAAHAAPSSSHGFLVLETNFRLYAYTGSALWARVLGEFARIQYQLPNLIVAQLERDSILHAVDAGVEPQQIVAFLERNAHPQMAAQTPVLPDTVVHQLLLWAKESERLQAVPARLYDKFASVAIFERAEQYARDIGAYQWSRRDTPPVNPPTEKCVLVVAADAHERMKGFLRKTQQQLQQ